MNLNERMRALKERLSQGVQVVSADQLFPTPVDLARRLVELAEPRPGLRWLEPSAGTGRLLDAVFAVDPEAEIEAVEINPHLVEHLRHRYPDALVFSGDFIDYGDSTPDRIVMNPPFSNGMDVKHILRAYDLLAVGGILAAICADGPRQRKALQTIAESYEPLELAFVESGTRVNVALLIMKKYAK